MEIKPIAKPLMVKTQAKDIHCATKTPFPERKTP